MDLPTRSEGKRGCGYRQPGGLYLVADGVPAECGRLPLPCEVCPTCGHGLKPARGWTWVDVPALVQDVAACEQEDRICARCPLRPTLARAGLLWIGEQFYKSPTDFLREAQRMGISRRIAAVPQGFVLGETWVLVAHRRAIMTATDTGEVIYTPGIFQAFRPTRIEYVVRENDTSDKLVRLRDRGVTPVRVVRTESTALALPLGKTAGSTHHG